MVHELNPGAARRLAQDAMAVGDILVWHVAIEADGDDSRAVARPHAQLGTLALPYALSAPTIDILHEQLPPGLARLSQQGDQEIWF